MTTAAGTLPRLPRWLVHFMLKPGNWIPAVVWFVLVVIAVVKLIDDPWVSTIGVLAINSVAMVLFVTRRDASTVGKTWEGLLAVLGTFIVTLLLFVPEGTVIFDVSTGDGYTLGPSANIWATVIQCVGLAGWVWSLLSLGRSLGIAPADRGLVRHGPYRFIRHPLYAFEALFFIGWLINVQTISVAVIIAVWAALQIGRIIREERIIAGYDEYRQQVRWRLIPFVW